MNEARLHRWGLKELPAWEQRQPGKYELIRMDRPRRLAGASRPYAGALLKGARSA